MSGGATRRTESGTGEASAGPGGGAGTAAVACTVPAGPAPGSGTGAGASRRLGAQARAMTSIPVKRRNEGMDGYRGGAASSGGSTKGPRCGPA